MNALPVIYSPPLIRAVDPSASPLAFFGAELRRARSAAGLSQEQLGQHVGNSAAQVGKVEMSERRPGISPADATKR
jgi:DNA-binding XRE family transcriptional regulator